MKMLARVAEGWQRGGGRLPEVIHLAQKAGFRRAVEAFAEADVVLLGLPLYTDAMPAIVMAYIEALAPRVEHFRLIGRHQECNESGSFLEKKPLGYMDSVNSRSENALAAAQQGRANPSLAFLVQSGFPEARHSRPLERYLEKLARRLGSSYAGTIARGMGESLQSMPDKMNEKLWARLRTLGEQLARDGRFAAAELKAVAGIERFSPLASALLSVACKLPIVQYYWTSQLKKNGAWKHRFAAPYGPALL